MKRILLATLALILLFPLAAAADVGAAEADVNSDMASPACGNGVLDEGEMCDYAAPSPNEPCGGGMDIVCNARCVCDSSFCEDGVICSDCSDAEECDPYADPPGCGAGYVCDRCRCKKLEILKPVQRNREIRMRPIQIQK